MTREEHYTDGRRWSHISKAWILLSSWNDREELATMTVAAESVRLENVRQRAEIARLKEICERVAYEVMDYLNTATPGGKPEEPELWQAVERMKQEHRRQIEQLQAQLATAKREVWTRVDEYYSRTIHHDMDDYPDKFVKWVRQQKEAL